MKILIISNLYPPYILGGYEILCGQVVQHLEERGHSLFVLTSDHESPVSTDTVRRSLRLYLPFSEPGDFNRFDRVKTQRFNHRETAAVIEEVKPDVIFIWSILRLTLGPARAAEESGIPTLYTFNDEHMAGFAPTRCSSHPRKAVRWFTDRFITPQITFRGLRFPTSTSISRLLKDNLIAGGVPVEDSTVIYQGIPLEEFPLKPDAGSMGNPIRILYAGQLHHYKGVHTILEALSLLEEKTACPPCTLSIAGTGPDAYVRELKELSGRLEVLVTFLGRLPHDQMKGLYQSHDLFIFPSIWEEPFGLTHLEAMSSGLAVISTANGGQGEFLEDGKNALTFSPGDAGELAEAIGRMAGDSELYSRLTENGRETAVTRFSFTRYVDEIETLLQSVLD